MEPLTPPPNGPTKKKKKTLATPYFDLHKLKDIFLHVPTLYKYICRIYQGFYGTAHAYV